ncbi:histidine kinase [Amorphoplanes nipponensis]|uniref:histidine kinase n=1 Tax=Actinoplanes nipponensis TaxID=135950 RepID=A0A919MNS1_9ACTN|nr:histidine kinase [Actinoplanes nipponensis]GIE51277.1 two-component sensor histidine kinase [Actinoplanes nipponensis]
MEGTGGMVTKRWPGPRWHPLLVDALLAVVLAGFVLKSAVLEPGAALADTVTLGDVLVAVVAFLAVLQRRSHPRAALVIATGATVGGITQGVSNPGLIMVLGVITYSIAAHRNRRDGWTCALAAATVVYAAAVLVSAGWRPDVLAVFAWIFMAAAVGDAARSHRAYVAEVEARAHRAEQTREQEARRRVSDERLRIARELHDVVAHHIAVISVQAGAATHVLERRPDQVGPVLAHIREASDLVLKEIASVVGVLRNSDEQASTEPAPGLARLPELLGALEAAGFAVRHQRRGEPRELPALVDLAAYRIVQEALTNAHRYGDGRAALLVEYAPSGVVLEVTNDVRPDRGAEGTGYGLLGMRERATAAGGAVTAGPLGDGRFRVHAVLPTEDARPAGCHR